MGEHFEERTVSDESTLGKALFRRLALTEEHFCFEVEHIELRRDLFLF